jgi:hypothetical protein
MGKPSAIALGDFALVLLRLTNDFVEKFGRQPSIGDSLFFGETWTKGEARRVAKLMKSLGFSTAILDGVKQGVWCQAFEDFRRENPPSEPVAPVLDGDDELIESACLHLSFLNPPDSILIAIDHMKAAFIRRTVGEMASDADDITVVDPQARADTRDSDIPNAWSLHIHGEVGVVVNLLDILDEVGFSPRGTLMLRASEVKERFDTSDRWNNVEVVALDELNGGARRTRCRQTIRKQ